MFEWDEAKYELNLEKHKVDFYDAILIFENDTFEVIDDREDYGEIRINAIGYVDDEFYVVTYTWRGETMRIISARKAGRRDRRKYQARYAERGEGKA